MSFWHIAGKCVMSFTTAIWKKAQVELSNLIRECQEFCQGCGHWGSMTRITSGLKRRMWPTVLEFRQNNISPTRIQSPVFRVVHACHLATLRSRPWPTVVTRRHGCLRPVESHRRSALGIKSDPGHTTGHHRGGKNSRDLSVKSGGFLTFRPQELLENQACAVFMGGWASDSPAHFWIHYFEDGCLRREVQRTDFSGRLRATCFETAISRSRSL